VLTAARRLHSGELTSMTERRNAASTLCMSAVSPKAQFDKRIWPANHTHAMGFSIGRCEIDEQKLRFRCFEMQAADHPGTTGNFALCRAASVWSSRLRCAFTNSGGVSASHWLSETSA
jgi:hypothetical protein